MISGIQKVSSEKEAIELVNDSDLGLTGGVYTKDAERYSSSLFRGWEI
jgi:acyl-CoA reductase-like NAD-dependent aldehyde dehydrogenase